jgi:ABC-type dipeptide/oligopeptide/nickel transport system ATPase subunit
MPESQNPNSLNLILENIGPIKSAEIELGRVTVLYGANATGKTTVARVLEDAVKLMNNIGVECSELAELVRHDAKVGRIVLNDYEVSLERGEKVNVVIKRGAETLHSGGCGAGVYATGLHIAELIDTLVWVRYNDVRLIGIDFENVLNLEMLLKPMVKKYFGSDELKAAKEYDDYIYDVNHKVSALTGGWFVIQDDIFFNDGDYFYKLNHVAEGVKRTALIIATKVLAERLRGRRPVLFVEGLEPLHVDMIEGILDEFEDTRVPVVVETHSGFAIKQGVLRKWSVYVLKDGSAFNDLTRPELFSSEAVVASEVGEVL